MSPPPPRRPPWLMLILALALAVRLAFVLGAGERELVGDEVSYDDVAFNLASGHGYTVGQTDAERRPTAFRGPSYVLLTAAFYELAGRRLVPPLVANCVFEVLACWLAYRIARSVFASEAAGLGAAALYAVYPPFILYAGQLIPESLTNLTVLATTAAFLGYVERRRTRDLVLAGVSLAVCALNKPHLAPIGVILPLAALPKLGWRKAIRSAAVVTLVTSSLMSPWIVRNALVFHELLPGLTAGGVAFWGGTAPYAGRLTGGLANPWVPESFQETVARMDEPDQNRFLMKEGFRVIASDPWRYVRVTIRKFFALWLNLGYDDPPSRSSYALAAFNLAAIALAVVAARALRPDPVAVRALVGLWLFWNLVNVPVCTVVRYAMPYYALLFSFTGAGLALVARRLAGPRPALAVPGAGRLPGAGSLP